METDQAQCLLLQAGEQILCTRCQAALAVAPRDLFGTLRGLLRLGGIIGKKGSDGSAQLLCRCGGGAAPGADGASLYDQREARLLVRSGSWIGWRELGGE